MVAFCFDYDYDTVLFLSRSDWETYGTFHYENIYQKHKSLKKPEKKLDTTNLYLYNVYRVSGVYEMSLISLKCQYALRAVFELAKRQGRGPVKIGKIAEVQAIPQRFLETILNQLRQSGVVESRRGKDGGYLLARDYRKLTVGQVIRIIQGPPTVVDCASGRKGKPGAFDEDSVFLPLWEKAEKALSEVYESATFQDLVRQEEERLSHKVQMYSI